MTCVESPVRCATALMGCFKLFISAFALLFIVTRLKGDGSMKPNIKVVFDAFCIDIRLLDCFLSASQPKRLFDEFGTGI